MKFSNIIAITSGLFSAAYGMTWDEADKKAAEFVKDLTMDEKIGFVTGYKNGQNVCVGEIRPLERKNFKGLCLQDGPAGPRWAPHVTSWQTGINTAATFNRDLVYKYAQAQGLEFKAKGMNIALGPSMNIIRSPVAGRNFENFSEDPYLSGQCAYQEITGMQDVGCMVAAKHFVMNEQETNREASSNTLYDERSLYEIYIEPFYKSIEAGAGSLMVSYNGINGTYNMQSHHMLTEVAKEQLGFKGFLMSDWWGVHDTEISFNAGVDMNMAGGMAWGPDYMTDDTSFWGTNLKQAIEDGKVDASRLDDAVLRIVRSIYKLEQMENFPDIDFNADVTEGHKEINLQAAQESTILLKNENNILPIKKSKKIKKIAVIGKDSLPTVPCTDSACAEGTLIQGWGSGTTTITNVIDPLSAIQERASKDKLKVVSFPEDDAEGAANIAKDVDLAVVFVQAHSGEGYLTVEGNAGDRLNLDLWHNGNELVSAVAKANKNVVVVIHGPGVVNLPFLDDVKGLIFAGYPGQETGHAIASVLFGDVNPSGHLPFTWGKSREDYCCDVPFAEKLVAGGEEKTIYEYTEGMYVGYRWFDKHSIEPHFPFGFGLSYTTFDYDDLKLSTVNDENDELEKLTATFTVTNTGKVDGAAVPMLFLSFPDVEEMGDYPVRSLKGYEKVQLKAGETKTVTIEVEKHELSYYNVETKQYTVPTGGEFKVYIGSNAKDFELGDSIENTNKMSMINDSDVEIDDQDSDEEVSMEVNNDEDSDEEINADVANDEDSE